MFQWIDIRSEVLPFSQSHHHPFDSVWMAAKHTHTHTHTHTHEGAAWAKISLRRTEHFVQMCILYPREKKKERGVDKMERKNSSEEIIKEAINNCES